MAFPTQREMLANALSRIQSRARSLKQTAISARSRLQSAPTPAEDVFRLIDVMQTFAEDCQAVGSIPGIAAYATDQLGQDVTADFTAMRQAAEAAANWLIAAVPKDANGYLLIQTVNARGDRIDRTFTPAQVAPLVPLLDTLIASID
jgi:hypothetical protein